ncbi:hypothetical protein [Asticcacaulis sp. YBE204]|uniref:hypothetical protein n=1 Tax=Asticcacaulis sp. YBE204 TaxID=1282363 RepID=UPI0003C3B4D6|nr:hypothetical protein [Asticcacaulis sp. YBE204]ESQ80109.1 hypothetical protein AEYBE204_05685 [Asticcacaulis sp. YBE204]
MRVSIKGVVVLGLAMAGLAACATAPLRAAPESFVGQGSAAVLASWGKPDSTVAGEGGAEVWTYKREISKATTSSNIDRTEQSEELSTGSRLKSSGSGTKVSKDNIKLTCETRFTVAGGQVTAGVSEGDGCIK